MLVIFAANIAKVIPNMILKSIFLTDMFERQLGAFLDISWTLLQHIYGNKSYNFANFFSFAKEFYDGYPPYSISWSNLCFGLYIDFHEFDAYLSLKAIICSQSVHDELQFLAAQNEFIGSMTFYKADQNPFKLHYRIFIN